MFLFYSFKHNFVEKKTPKTAVDELISLEIVGRLMYCKVLSVIADNNISCYSKFMSYSNKLSYHFPRFIHS